MRTFWMFVLLCMGMCSCAATTKSGDVRLFDTKVCVKGEQTVTKTVTTCDKAPPLNLEGTSPFDLTKQTTITAQ